MTISMNNLGMRFGNGVQALADVNLEIGSGVFGLLGANGSGKSTLIRILATLQKPTEGRVSVGSLDLARNRAAVRAMTGYLPQRFGEFTNVTTWEFLDYNARLAGLTDKTSRASEVDYLLDTLGLDTVRDTRANRLSIPQKRSLEIAQAVIGSPRILLVDEPTSGLSTEERARFKKLLADRAHSIDLVILSTHILSDITSTFSGLAILDKGRVVYTGPADLSAERITGYMGPPPPPAPKPS